MRRILEELGQSVVFPPQAVAAGTAADTGFVDGAETGEVEFLLATGALAAGKTLTVEVYTSGEADGTGAEKAAEAVFTAGDAMEGSLAAVSWRPNAEHGRYVGVKFRHDGDADLICAVTAVSRVDFLPAGNGWRLVV